MDPELDGLRTARAQVCSSKARWRKCGTARDSSSVSDRVGGALAGSLALQQNDLQGGKALEARRMNPTRGMSEVMGMVCMSTGNWSPCIDSLVAGWKEHSRMELFVCSWHLHTGNRVRAKKRKWFLRSTWSGFQKTPPAICFSHSCTWTGERPKKLCIG